MNKNNPAERLRIIRKSKGWSLQDVELHSNGKWKAVVIGSYERGDRAISLKKSISLMEFYQVPISELFPEVTPIVSARSLTLDLVRISTGIDANTEQIRRFTKLVSDRRKDWNGQLLTIRANDLQFLSLLLGLTDAATLDYLTEAELLTA
jgi:transcriptional regulator with XRE-family HTH domain